MSGNGGTARYFVRHSLFRTFGAVLGGLFRTVGMVLLLAGLWLLIHPWVAFWLLVAWWLRRTWRAHRRRLQPVPILSEHERLRLEAMRLRVLAAHLKVGPDVVAAERDYREGRISRHDLDVALQYAADEQRTSGRQFHFQH